MSAPTTTATFAASLVEQGSVSLRQFAILGVCFMLNMLDGFDVAALSFAAPQIGPELGVTNTQLGVAFSAALAGMMLGAMFLAPISDLIGRRAIILTGVTTIGLSMIATIYAPNLLMLSIIRFITGLGVGAMLASLAAIATEYLPEKYRSFGVVSITAGYPFGATVGALIVAPLIGDLGWRPIFVAGGVITVGMALVAALVIPESLEFLCNRRPRNYLAKVNRILSAIGKPTVDRIPDAAKNDDGTEAHNSGNIFANMLRLLTDGRAPRTLVVWSTFFFCFIALYFLMSWIPKLVVASGLSLELGTQTSAAFNFGGVAGILCLGFLSTRLPLSFLIGSFICSAAVLMFLFGFVPDSIAAMVLMTAAVGFLMQGGFTGMYAVASKIYPPEIRATGVGWAIGLGRFGAVVGPILGGIAIDQQYSMATTFSLFAVPLLIGGVLALTLKVR